MARPRPDAYFSPDEKFPAHHLGPAPRAEAARRPAHPHALAAGLSAPPPPGHATVKIVTKSFRATQPIPVRFTADGDNINPPLEIRGVPPGARSLALVVDDPDAPLGAWNHWLLWNIPPGTTSIRENSVPRGAVVGCNDAGTNRYVGPSPPSGTHRYCFRLYALDTRLTLPSAARRPDLDQALHGHILDRSELTGRYGRE